MVILQIKLWFRIYSPDLMTDLYCHECTGGSGEDKTAQCQYLQRSSRISWYGVYNIVIVQKASSCEEHSTIVYNIVLVLFASSSEETVPLCISYWSTTVQCNGNIFLNTYGDSNVQ